MVRMCDRHTEAKPQPNGTSAWSAFEEKNHWQTAPDCVTHATPRITFIVQMTPITWTAHEMMVPHVSSGSASVRSTPLLFALSISASATSVKDVEVRVEMKHATMTAYTPSRHKKKIVVRGWSVRYGIDLKARIDS